MRALVTGASGFIGSTLIEELGTLGFDVHALMRKTSIAANLEGLKFRRVEGELAGPDHHARWQGVDLAGMEPEAMEAVLADTVLKEFKVRLGRIGVEYQTPIRP